MTTAIIITLCSLLLVAYVFALTSAKTKIPSVLLLLILGWAAKQATVFLHIQLPDFNPALPVIATIGLVLIVLEGSLELKVDRTKIGLITKSFFGALIPIILLAVVIAYGFHYLGDYDLRLCFINAIPFCIISSAIAIPSAVNLDAETKEFVIYESSLSDILGVLIFNFLLLNKVYDQFTFLHFGLQILLMLVISIAATLALSFLLARITHHVKFVPIILLVVLLYTVLKEYHLPSLIFILLFGLFIGHLHKFKDHPWAAKLIPYDPEKDVELFTVLTIEGTFLIRSLFFFVFGFLLETSELTDIDSGLLAVTMVCLFMIVRIIQLAISRLPLAPLLFVAPRGLITILLFLYITPAESIELVNRSLIIQVIVLTVLVMTFGMMASGSSKKTELEPAMADDAPSENPIDEQLPEAISQVAEEPDVQTTEEIPDATDPTEDK
ncbi:MAG: cation:proton antiporter [Flavobacteriales bacterium]|nr:cation:proton antiporter [Flavobacteriales bacterium]